MIKEQLKMGRYDLLKHLIQNHLFAFKFKLISILNTRLLFKSN